MALDASNTISQSNQSTQVRGSFNQILSPVTKKIQSVAGKIKEGLSTVSRKLTQVFSNITSLAKKIREEMKEMSGFERLIIVAGIIGNVGIPIIAAVGGGLIIGASGPVGIPLACLLGVAAAGFLFLMNDNLAHELSCARRERPQENGIRSFKTPV
jgi:hypothetical protein